MGTVRYRALVVCMGALLSATLAGCGARQTVAVERGGRLAALGNSAMDSSRDVLGQVRAANETARIEIVVADPSCKFRDVRIAPDPAPAGTILCSPDGVPFSNVDAAAVAPTLRLIEGLVTYFSAVDDTVSGAAFDSAGAVEQALVDANNIATIVTTGGPGPFSGDQIAAAAGLAGLLGRIADTRQRADRLRVIEAEHPKVPAIIDSLDKDIAIWSGSSLPANLAAIDAAYDTRAFQIQKALVAERKSGSGLAADAAWRSFLQSWSQVRSQKEASAALPREMKRLMGSLRKAHAGYARVLDPNAELTDADRAEIARVQRQQLSEILASIAGIFKAFL